MNLYINKIFAVFNILRIFYPSLLTRSKVESFQLYPTEKNIPIRNKHVNHSPSYKKDYIKYMQIFITDYKFLLRIISFIEHQSFYAIQYTIRSLNQQLSNIVNTKFTIVITSNEHSDLITRNEIKYTIAKYAIHKYYYLLNHCYCLLFFMT